MNDPAEQLLDDLMTERAASFDETVLASTLQAVRRRRLRRQGGRAAMAVAVLVGLAFWWAEIPRDVELSHATVPAPMAVPEYLVRSAPLSRAERVVSHSAALTVVTSRPDEFRLVSTVSSPDLYQPLTDDELKLLLAGHEPVILRQPNQPALVLLRDGRPAP